MYLKNIEINGFKSFANRIVFEFPQGITGIVGPNGSGKSNIGDAVRWVLGEQSAKQLRGSRMEDVIFSGTQSRKPMGFAYVAITFENSNRIIPLDYEEVTVARRVYRSGESEYLINGSICRRRDIVELFYDTGIGKEGYSIIGQGQVEKILSGKIEDSRELFDEAAGIAKYKKNRAVTEKSLEQERQNLERVTDILSELEKQVGPLAAQSAKAKEYLKYRDEEKELDVHLFLADYEALSKEKAENGRQHEIVKGNLDEVRMTCEKVKEKNAAIQAQSGELSSQIDKDEGSLEEIRRKKEDCDNEILLLSHKTESNTLLMKHYEDLAGQNREDAEKKTLEAAAKKEEISEKEQLLLEGREELSRLSGCLLEKKEKQAAIEGKIAGENERQLFLMSSSSDTKEKLSRYSAMAEQLEIRNAEYNSRYLAFSAELKEYNENAKTLFQEKEEAKKSYRKQEEICKELSAKYTSVKKKAGDCEAELARLNQDYLRAKSRYETLVNISERYDGYNQSIRRVMEQKSKNPGIIGVVADILTLPKKYETAIEIALGGALQNIVTEDNEVAKKMIDYLKKNRFGRATFLPLTNIRKKNASFSKAVLESEGVIGTADSLVSVEDRFRNLADSLLGRTIVVDTVEHALAISRRSYFSLRLVTLDGELLNPGGAITGGAFRHSGNLLGRKREIEEGKAALKSLKVTWEERKKSLSAFLEEGERLKKERDAKQALLDEAGLTLHDLANQLPELNTRREELKRQIASLKEEHQAIKEQLSEIQAQKEALLKEQEDNRQIHVENNTALDALKAALAALTGELVGLEQKKNEQLLAVSGLQQEIDFLKNDAKRLEAERDELLENQEKNQREREALLLENASYEKEEQSIQQQAKVLQSQQEELANSLRQLKEQRTRLSARQNQIFQEMEQANEQLRILEKEESRLFTRQERIKEELDTRIDYMWESYELTYNQALPLRRYEIRTVELSEYRKRKKELQRQIKALGNVNVNAIEEYRDVGERYDFLKKQYDDIKEAEGKLLTMIDELNAAMKEQFGREFANIRETFTKVFQDLFEGGTASLELMDESSILECGIRIIAQPPGKKLQNILLLSGGERALTAIALLFAIQNLKPSPFCLLDEIEAALDDANIVRFSKYLKQLSRDTQFIVITHRRGTMSAADALYGITMQEKGISTLISVDLIDKELK